MNDPTAVSTNSEAPDIGDRLMKHFTDASAVGDSEADFQHIVEFMLCVRHERPRRPKRDRVEPARERMWRCNRGADQPNCLGQIVARSVNWSNQSDLPLIKRSLHKPRKGQGRFQRFSSRVAGRMLLAESSLEFDVFRNCELDPGVQHLVEQPFRLKYRFGTMWRRYTPDLIIFKVDGLEVIEVKPEDTAGRIEHEPRWNAIGCALVGLGFSFRVLTERHVRCEPRKTNVETIYRHRHVPFPLEIAEAVKNALEERGPQPAAALTAQFGLELGQIWSMVRALYLTVALDDEKLGPSTPISARRMLPEIREN